MTPDQLDAYRRDGAVVLPGLFSPDELGAALAALDGGDLPGVRGALHDRAGNPSELAIWFDHPAHVLADLGLDERVVAIARTVLGGDVYHWHSKLIFKAAGSTGGFDWHQDYGYWYDDGCPFPRMMSVMIALDAATRANGCLELLLGSQHLGRINHGYVGEDVAADRERVALLTDRFERRAVELAPGDALVLDCLTLHASAPNPSPHPRRALIVSFNAMDNVPVGGKGHGQPVAL